MYKKNIGLSTDHILPTTIIAEKDQPVGLTVPHDYMLLNAMLEAPLAAITQIKKLGLCAYILNTLNFQGPYAPLKEASNMVLKPKTDWQFSTGWLKKLKYVIRGFRELCTNLNAKKLTLFF